MSKVFGKDIDSAHAPFTDIGRELAQDKDGKVMQRLIGEAENEGRFCEKKIAGGVSPKVYAEVKRRKDAMKSIENIIRAVWNIHQSQGGKS